MPDADAAFIWLERAYKQRDPGLTYLKGDPLLKNLECDPRYIAFLKKMHLLTMISPSWEPQREAFPHGRQPSIFNCSWRSRTSQKVAFDLLDSNGLGNSSGRV